MKKRYLFSVALLLLVGAAFFLPEPRLIPVSGATASDWHKDTFWFEPWGTSGVHKGMDIFASSGTPVIAPTNLLVLYRGALKKGGKVVVALGPKWRIHYFAHLSHIDRGAGLLVAAGESMGGVGDTGNAGGKAPHLHYSIVSLLPRPWAMDDSTQGYKKAFYIDPISYFSE